MNLLKKDFFLQVFWPLKAQQGKWKCIAASSSHPSVSWTPFFKWCHKNPQFSCLKIRSGVVPFRSLRATVNLGCILLPTSLGSIVQVTSAPLRKATWKICRLQTQPQSPSWKKRYQLLMFPSPWNNLFLGLQCRCLLHICCFSFTRKVHRTHGRCVLWKDQTLLFSI